MGTLDGPGVRAVVFMQGCPLRCAYCHNPDTWPLNGGIPMQVSEVMARVLRVRRYFGAEGGITVSGGEPLLQAAFVAELFSECHAQRIHTALDTSGCLWNSDAARLLDVTDLCLLDIKMTEEAAYRRYTGGSLEKALSFLGELQERAIDTWVRHVVVPGITDGEEQIQTLKELVAPFECVKKIELLPFRKLCLTKYDQLGIPFSLRDVDEPAPEVMAALNRVLERE